MTLRQRWERVRSGDDEALDTLFRDVRESAVEAAGRAIRVGYPHALVIAHLNGAVYEALLLWQPERHGLRDLVLDRLAARLESHAQQSRSLIARALSMEEQG